MIIRIPSDNLNLEKALITRELEIYRSLREFDVDRILIELKLER